VWPYTRNQVVGTQNFKKCSLSIYQKDGSFEYPTFKTKLVLGQQVVPIGQVEKHEGSPEAKVEASQHDEFQIRIRIGDGHLSNFQIIALREHHHQEYHQRMDVRHLINGKLEKKYSIPEMK